MATKSKITIITNEGELNKLILSVNQGANALYAQVQTMLASATFQAVAHGNVNTINEAIIAVGRGMRKQAMGDWLMKFAPVMPNTGKDAKEKPFVFSREKFERLTGQPKNLDHEAALAYATKVHETHWTELKEPPLVPDSYNIGEQLARIVKQAESLGGKGVKIVGGDLLEYVKRLSAKAQPLDTTPGTETPAAT